MAFLQEWVQEAAQSQSWTKACQISSALMCLGVQRVRQLAAKRLSGLAAAAPGLGASYEEVQTQQLALIQQVNTKFSFGRPALNQCLPCRLFTQADPFKPTKHTPHMSQTQIHSAPLRSRPSTTQSAGAAHR